MRNWELGNWELAIGNRISASQKSEELKGKEHMVLLAFTNANGVLFGWLLYITVFAGYWGGGFAGAWLQRPLQAFNAARHPGSSLG